MPIFGTGKTLGGVDSSCLSSWVLLVLLIYQCGRAASYEFPKRLSTKLQWFWLRYLKAWSINFLCCGKHFPGKKFKIQPRNLHSHEQWFLWIFQEFLSCYRICWTFFSTHSKEINSLSCFLAWKPSFIGQKLSSLKLRMQDFYFFFQDRPLICMRCIRSS